METVRYRPFEGHDDLTSLARRRGRSITASIARLIETSDRGGFWLDMRAALAGRTEVNPNTTDGTDYSALVQDAEHVDIVRHIWRNHIDPAGGWN